jgi:hypothetical protein
MCPNIQCDEWRKKILGTKPGKYRKKETERKKRPCVALIVQFSHEMHLTPVASNFTVDPPPS